MRELTGHKVNGVNDGLAVLVMDEPGPGGANHHYNIIWNRKTHAGECGTVTGDECSLNFQNGPIREVGTNGVTHEALLAILIDRLEGFQRGKFACDKNAVALGHLRLAVTALTSRTLERAARGVEGTHQV